jgi:hypothetical protein
MQVRLQFSNAALHASDGIDDGLAFLENFGELPVLYRADPGAARHTRLDEQLARVQRRAGSTPFRGADFVEFGGALMVCGGLVELPFRIRDCRVIGFESGPMGFKPIETQASSGFGRAEFKQPIAGR